MALAHTRRNQHDQRRANLARVDLRCRELVRDLSQSKYAKGRALARPFRGLNGRGFVAVGASARDLLGRRSLGNADKREEQKSCPHRAWARARVGSQKEPSVVQGITELVECERTRDAWLQNVQEQLRDGALTADDHAFLHGHDASCPGSWSGETL